MVYTGRPSAGCENCRKAKKRCDEQLPCARCARLNLTCGGYRDMNQLIFHDQSESVSRRHGGAAGSTKKRSQSPAKAIPPKPEALAQAMFFDQLVTETFLSCLQDVTPDEFLMRPILACGFSILANRSNDPTEGRKLATQHYIEAIAATNTALRHPRRVREDNTVLAVFLLGAYERINHEGPRSAEAWTQHMKGTSMCLQLRGRSQLRTKSGASLFRDLRADIVINAMMMEMAAPEYIGQWSQSLEYDPVHAAGDQLIVIASRIARMREAFLMHGVEDNELLDTANILEQDIMSWSQMALTAGTSASFHNVNDPQGAHAWSGQRHEYGMPQAYRHWNMFRCIRIVLSRTQEALWRRSWPALVQPTQTIPDPETFKNVRNRMVEDICIAAAYAFGSDNSVDPPGGSVSSALLLLNPLALAGTHLIEQLAPKNISPGGSKIMTIDQPHHLDPSNHISAQLGWIIERIDYIANRVGLCWAVTLSKFLKGDSTIRYDVERSRALGRSPIGERQNPMLDLNNICHGSEMES